MEFNLKDGFESGLVDTQYVPSQIFIGNKGDACLALKDGILSANFVSTLESMVPTTSDLTMFVEAIDLSQLYLMYDIITTNTTDLHDCLMIYSKVLHSLRTAKKTIDEMLYKSNISYTGRFVFCGN